jgi:hypothetical protein
VPEVAAGVIQPDDEEFAFAALFMAAYQDGAI